MCGGIVNNTVRPRYSLATASANKPNCIIELLMYCLAMLTYSILCVFICLSLFISCYYELFYYELFYYELFYYDVYIMFFVTAGETTVAPVVVMEPALAAEIGQFTIALAALPWPTDASVLARRAGGARAQSNDARALINHTDTDSSIVGDENKHEFDENDEENADDADEETDADVAIVQDNTNARAQTNSSGGCTDVADTRAALHGQSVRQQVDVLRRFRLGECNILVATSVAEEGLDIQVILEICGVGDF